MIPTQPKMELSANRPDNSSEVVYEIPDTADDEDIHICGVCKNQFSDIFIFIRHKSEDGCLSSRGKSDVSVSISHTSPIPVNTHQFQSLAAVGTEVRSTVLPKTKYHHVTVETAKICSVLKSSSPQSPLSQPPHLLLAELACRQQVIDGSGHLVNDEFEDENHHESGPESIIDHQSEWNSPWTRPVPAFSSLDTQSSPHRTAHCDLEMQEQEEHNQNRELAQDQLMNLQASSTLRSSLRRSDFLDVEEDVATLLANHLTNEPLQPSTHSSPSEASNENTSLQLILKGDNHGREFELDSDEITDQNFSSRDVPLPVEGAPAAIHNVKRRRLQGSTHVAAAKKVVLSSTKSSPSASKAITQKAPFQKGNSHLPECNGETSSRRPFSCKIEGCNFSSQSSRDLHRHMCRHTGERPFTCDQCGKGFTRADKLTTHIRIHTGAKSYKCELCSYACVEHTGLVRHMRVHTDERPYKCQICDYSARVISHLKVHLRTHTGVHPYQCSYQCGKAFKTSSDLKRHERSHAGVKPHACSLCSYKTVTKSNLQIHMRQTHSSNQTYPCRQCPEICYSKRDQRWHERTHAVHLEPCSKCDFVSLTTSGLKEHLKSHSVERPFVCKFCSFSSNRRGNYRAHMRKQHAYLQTPKSSQRVDVQKKPQEVVRAHQEVDNRHECLCCGATFTHAVLLANHVQEHEDDPDSSDDPAPLHCSLAQQDSVAEQEQDDDPDNSEPFLPPLPAPQDPVLADSADSRDSTDNTSVDNSESYTSLVNLATCSEQMQPIYLYRHVSPELSDNVRGAEILASLNQGGGVMPQYVTVQSDQNAFVESLGGIHYVLCGPLDDNDNAANLLC